MSGFLDSNATALAAQIAALKLQNEQLKEEASPTSPGSDSSSSNSSSSDSSSSSESDSDSDSDGGETKSTTTTTATTATTTSTATTSKFTDDADADFFDQLSSNTAEEVLVEGHEYFVNLPCHAFGPGIVWETDWGGKKTTVKAFKRLEDGQHGPAANSGLIDIGHVLVAVNGKRIVGKPFEEQVKYVERASKKKKKGTKEYILTMCDPERHDTTKTTTVINSKGTTTTSSSSSSSNNNSNSNSNSNGAAMNQALKEVHRNKLKYYQAVPAAQDMTCCFLERYRGDHVTSFHMHRQIDSAFVMAASMPCAMKGDVIFHTLQDMTWEATMKDISTGNRRPHSKTRSHWTNEDMYL